mmetsp:Transcript_18349/g.46362  ORF Transcript_18349/g.46362 Transcript_18349/m.46362 type:complete len:342 (-) Transcript_18349:220-1245(-)
MTETKEYIWLDCDPGHDDAMAIILAAYHPKLHLLGISTVAGNQTLSKVTRNALDVLHAAGIHDVPVVAGASKPLIRPSPILCPEIHGESGLDGPQGGPLLPRSPQAAHAGKAVNVMAETIMKQHAALQGDKRIRLVCTGALTNAALLFSLYPELIPMVGVVIMGGAMGVGNTGPVVEFNIQTDPEAAACLFGCGVPLTMVPLEVTHTVLVTPEVLAMVRHADTATSTCTQPDSRFRAAVEQLLLFFKDTYKEVFNFIDPPLHDPCAVAYVAEPELFKGRHMRVDIETASPYSSGQTVCDIWNQTGRPHNCMVTTAVDVTGFWKAMGAALGEADKRSPLNAP